MAMTLVGYMPIGKTLGKSKLRVGGGTNANTGEEKEDNLQYFNEMSGKQETHLTTSSWFNQV